MNCANFVHLTVRTAYSLAEGAIKIDELVDLCGREGMPAVAATDSGNLFGALEFAVTAARAGVQPIVGITLNIRRPEEDASRMRAPNGAAPVGPAPDQLVLLAMNESGYRNLLDLATEAFLNGDESEYPQLDIDDLEGRSDGLIALTGGLRGAVGRLLVEGRLAEAEAALTALHRLFGDRLYVELQRHGLDEERRIEPQLLNFAHTRDIPLVATNDCHFMTKDMFHAHEVLLCIAQSTTISDPKRREVTADHYFKSARDMCELFSDLPEAIENTIEIARRCAYVPEVRDPILPPYETAGGRDVGEELRDMARQGLERRLARFAGAGAREPDARAEAERPYRERLDMELDVIIKMGFAGYFLIVADFIQWAKNQGIPVGPGRGSGAGSVVAWSLLITDLDPLQWGLLFERFLNPERVSMPDFDIDFCQDRRGEVIEYVQQEYGDDRVAQIITFGKLQARAVLRDVGRVLEMPYGQVDRICKLVPNNPASPVGLADAIAGEELLQQQRDGDETVRTLLDIGLKLEGLYRNASTHAAGVVIGDRPLKELVPLYRDPRSGMPATQFSMKWAENAGLVKFDFLGLKTLSVLQKTVELLAQRGIAIDLETLPLDDAGTYEMIGRAESTGVFQLESSGMRDVLRKMRPDRFEDIIALVALYRPGPMQNIASYISRKHGEESVVYVDPRLEPVLEETYGIFIYQEQVQQAAQVLAGYTLGGADLLRRAMGKKLPEEMAAQQEVFVSGSVERGMTKEQATAVFDTIAAFAGYGFNKSHAAAYALVAYQTAYMKAHYPVEFLAASMSYDMNNGDKLNLFKQELQSLGFQLLPPDVNRSERYFAVEQDENDRLAVRYALAAIKNVGGPAMTGLMQEREANGRFGSLADFATRIDGRQVSKRMLEQMIRAGALDCLHDNRAQLLDGVELLLRHATAAQEERVSDQARLFDDRTDDREIRIALPDSGVWTPLQRLQEECDAIGFYLSSHPLEAYETELGRLDVVASARISEVVGTNNGAVRLNLAGVVTAFRIRRNQRGNDYAFVQMSDRSGGFEVTMFSEVLGGARALLENGRALLVRVDARAEDGSVRLTVASVDALDGAARHSVKGLKIYLRGAEPVPVLARVLSEHCKGRGQVKLVVQTGHREVDLALPATYQIDPQIRAAVNSLPGVIEVKDF